MLRIGYAENGETCPIAVRIDVLKEWLLVALQIGLYSLSVLKMTLEERCCILQ